MEYNVLLCCSMTEESAQKQLEAIIVALQFNGDFLGKVKIVQNYDDLELELRRDKEVQWDLAVIHSVVSKEQRESSQMGVGRFTRIIKEYPQKKFILILPENTFAKRIGLYRNGYYDAVYLNDCITIQVLANAVKGRNQKEAISYYKMEEWVEQHKGETQCDNESDENLEKLLEAQKELELLREKVKIMEQQNVQYQKQTHMEEKIQQQQQCQTKIINEKKRVSGDNLIHNVYDLYAEKPMVEIGGYVGFVNRITGKNKMEVTLLVMPGQPELDLEDMNNAVYLVGAGVSIQVVVGNTVNRKYRVSK